MLIESELSQIILAKVTFLISFNCGSVNLIKGFEVSCQKRSHFLKLSNWIPAIQPKVGPTDPPCNGYSDKPPVNKSISSTLLANHGKLKLKTKITNCNKNLLVDCFQSFN